MAIEELLRVVPPPKEPLATGDAARWAEVEWLLGTRLPRDLYDLVTHYGSGDFRGDFGIVEVLSPFSIDYWESLCFCCQELRDNRGLPVLRDIPYGVFPDRPGWLHWGHSDIGQTFCWITEGEPDDWPLLVISDSCRSFQQLRMSMTSFLAGLFSGRLRPSYVLREEYAYREGTQFEPIPTWQGRRWLVPQSPADVAARWEIDANRPPCPWEGEWFPPDELGRPTGARVAMGPGMGRASRWSGFAAEPFTVYPDWWTELPRPLHRWRRGQLLGWRLGGPGGTALHNLIPLTWKAQTKLWIMEGGAAIGVSSRSQMIHTVRALYEGANRYPSQVIIEYKGLNTFSGSDDELTIDTM